MKHCFSLDAQCPLNHKGSYWVHSSSNHNQQSGSQFEIHNIYTQPTANTTNQNSFKKIYKKYIKISHVSIFTFQSLTTGEKLTTITVICQNIFSKSESPKSTSNKQITNSNKS